MLVVEPVNPNNPNRPLAVNPIEDKTLRSMKPLLCNTPNPVKTSTTLRYCVPRTGKAQNISIRIYDANGRLVRTLINDITMGGNFLVQWDTRSTSGNPVPTGAYFVVLETSGGLRMMVQMKVVR
jgi:flagellar hook assembly protein FlgD